LLQSCKYSLTLGIQLVLKKNEQIKNPYLKNPRANLVFSGDRSRQMIDDHKRLIKNLKSFLVVEEDAADFLTATTSFISYLNSNRT